MTCIPDFPLPAKLSSLFPPSKAVTYQIHLDESYLYFSTYTRPRPSLPFSLWGDFLNRRPRKASSVEPLFAGLLGCDRCSGLHEAQPCFFCFRLASFIQLFSHSLSLEELFSQPDFVIYRVTFASIHSHSHVILLYPPIGFITYKSLILTGQCNTAHPPTSAGFLSASADRAAGINEM